MASDAIVVGVGLVGLCSAIALAERGVSVSLVGEHREGEASPAAAGMLAPSVEKATGSAHEFAVAARDRYPSYIEFLHERGGPRVSLNRLGVLQVALSERGVKGLKKAAAPGSSWLDAEELHRIEPAFKHAAGAVFNPFDGAVDNLMLYHALEELSMRVDGITHHNETAIEIDAHRNGCSVLTATQRKLSAGQVIIAAGAWVGQIRGARYARHVSPSRGQLVLYDFAPSRYVAYGPRGYIVPRGVATIAGSTMENVGFDARTSPEGIAKVRSAAEEICPQLAQAAWTGWAGLRPVTPDLLPMIGPDPQQPSVVYACGHSRNGVLMAPLTGDVIADLVTGTPLSHDLSQFRPDRF